MLLSVDIGNSRTKLGVFDGSDLTLKFSIPTTADPKTDLDTAFEPHRLTIHSAICCSVVPSVNEGLAAYVRERFGVEMSVVGNDADLGLSIRYEPIDAAGTDRIVNSFAAAEKYGVPCIVCSFGTATTIDVVNEKRELLGGLISPGMRTGAKALQLAAARLPEVEIDRPETLISHTTGTSIRSGLYYSQVGLVETAVRRIRDEIGEKAKVVATGGFASMIAESTDVIDILDEDLTLTGLKLIHDRQPA